MCGLAALFEPSRRFDPALLAGIEDDLFHRGPDSGGCVSEPGMALVFRRLAILDPGSQADQPMNDASGRCSLVFNGEIYNYRALRLALEQEGVHLRTQGDTEVVLEGYLRWGEDVLNRLEGMFAFCLVDRERGVALAARDPLGIKPLYMLHSGTTVAFASEMRPLFRLRPPQIDDAALAELVTFGWAAGRLSNCQGIERLPGGTLVTVPLAGGVPAERRYCDPLETLRPDPELNSGLNWADAEERVHEALEESVKAHLASDVGYAMQLSGGVDSSLVAALAQEETAGSLASFAVSLGDHPYDEGCYRDMVVQRHGLDHHEVAVSATEYAQALPRAVLHMEGPLPHGGCVALMLLCERIRKHSKVVLTGEGADEMFGGYQRYAVWNKTQWQERLARVLPARLLPPLWPVAGIRRMGGLDAAAYASVYHDFRAVQGVFPGLVPKPGAREAASRRFSDFRDRLFAVDQAAYLESLLVRQDKMSMAASVEARVPFVHMPLLRLVNGLPHALRAPGGDTKPLLKRMAERHLPHDLIHRRKIGLWLPYEEWFADAKGAGQYLNDLTGPDSRLAAYAEKGKLTALVDRCRAGARSAGLVLERLVGVELWLRSLAG
jgi:asparagine synthase (glutamine-hydrolysing)